MRRVQDNRIAVSLQRKTFSPLLHLYPPNTNMRTIAIITGAGLGTRMGSRIRKPYINLAGKPVLAHTILPFEQSNAVHSIILVVTPGDEDFCFRNVVKRFGFKKITKIVPGGKERQDSVFAGIMATDDACDIIVVHDSVRPFVTSAMIKKIILKAHRTGAAITAVPVKDTIKQVSAGVVKHTLSRDKLWAVQTPQAFKYTVLKKAHESARKQGFLGTDDAVLVERLRCRVAIIQGSYDNIKITTPEDLILGEAILKYRG